MDTPTEAPAYYPRWIITLDEDLDHTFLGLAKTPEAEERLILQEMGENDELRSDEGDATCLWLFIPDQVNPDDRASFPRLGTYAAGYMADLRKQAGAHQMFLVKLEYRIVSDGQENACDSLTGAIRNGLPADTERELLRTDVRRPGEAGEW